MCSSSHELPRSVNGLDFVNHLVRDLDYRRINQVGSHVTLHTDTPASSTTTIPAHKPLKTGTFAAIVKQVANHKRVTREQLLNGL